MTAEVGAWNPALFASFRDAAGPPPTKSAPRVKPLSPRARFLLNQLLIVNMPLVKKLVAQISGTQEHAGAPRGFSFAGKIKVRGAEAVDWDDLMQAGRVGMAEALDRLDPAKGKIATIAYWRILYEIQKVFRKQHFVRAGEGHEHERPQVAFFDDQEALDRMSLERAEACHEVEGITAATIEGWAASGQWPELEEWQAARRPALVSVPVALPLDALTSFLRTRCEAASKGRVANPDLWSAYVAHCQGKPEVARPLVLGAARARFRGRDLHIRTKWSAAERALSGFRLSASAVIP